MPFKTGNPGRPKGAKGRVTTVFKEAVLRAYEGIGGDAAFQRWARANPTDYYKIASKLIPQEIAMTTEVQPLIIDLVTPSDVQARREADAE